MQLDIFVVVLYMVMSQFNKYDVIVDVDDIV
jgi:hypothetical protein